MIGGLNSGASIAFKRFLNSPTSGVRPSLSSAATPSSNSSSETFSSPAATASPSFSSPSGCPKSGVGSAATAVSASSSSSSASKFITCAHRLVATGCNISFGISPAAIRRLKPSTQLSPGNPYMVRKEAGATLVRALEPKFNYSI